MENTPNPPAEIKVTWRPVQAYVMASICFAIGIALGFFVRGSAAPPSPVTVVNVAPSASTPVPGGMTQGKMPTLEQMKQMADKQAEPVLKKLKGDPKNAGLWNQVGLIYKATHQFKDAEGYFQKSLEIDPRNITVRADLASCMYYEGDVDGALAELNKSLTYDPKSAGTLMNIGIIRWKGKQDPDGAVVAWQELLKQNPDFEKKALIQHMIAEARQQRIASPPKG
jgi:cytochrome c-type biogenesis protein CcmH/NrfG